MRKVPAKEGLVPLQPSSALFPKFSPTTQSPWCLNNISPQKHWAPFLSPPREDRMEGVPSVPLEAKVVRSKGSAVRLAGCSCPLCHLLPDSNGDWLPWASVSSSLRLKILVPLCRTSVTRREKNALKAALERLALLLLLLPPPPSIPSS